MYSGFLVTQFGGNSVKELFEVDLSSEGFKIGDHVENGGVFGLESETLHCGFELTGIYFACGFSVKEVEGFPEFFDFVLSKSGSFNSFFSGTFGSNSSLHPILIKFKIKYE